MFPLFTRISKLAILIVTMSLNIFVKSAFACDFKISEFRTKLVSEKDERTMDRIDAFAEIKLYATALNADIAKLNLNYTSSLPGETSTPISKAVYDPKEKTLILKLTRNMADVFVQAGKQNGPLSQLVMLQLTAVSAQKACRIVADDVKSPPAINESRQSLYTPYSPVLLRKVFPLEKQFYALSTNEEKIRIVTKAYSILFTHPTPKLKTLLNRTGFNFKEAERIVLVPEFGNAVPDFPSIWRQMGAPDYVAHAMWKGMVQLNEYGKLTPEEIEDILYAPELSNSKVLSVATAGVENFTFSEFRFWRRFK